MFLANLLKKGNSCPECNGTRLIAYDEPEASNAPGGAEVFSWNITDRLDRVLKLTSGHHYICPGCGTYNLSFSSEMVCWD